MYTLRTRLKVATRQGIATLPTLPRRATAVHTPAQAAIQVEKNESKSKKRKHALIQEQSESAHKTSKQQQTKREITPWFTSKIALLSKHVLPVPQPPGNGHSSYRKDKTPSSQALSWVKKESHQHVHTHPHQFPFQLIPPSTKDKSSSRVDVARRSKKVAPQDSLLRCFKIKLHPTREFKQRAQRWISTCRQWRRLILNHLRTHNPKGFQKVPDWKHLKKLLNPCDCFGHEDSTTTCAQHPFWHHKLRHYLFNLPHPDPKKKIMVWKGGQQVEDYNFCSKDMKVATIHKLCSSIGSTIESLKEKRREKLGKCSKSEIFRVEEFEFTHQTQQDRTQSVFIECNGGAPSVKWDLQSGGFTFTPTYNPGVVRAKSKRQFRKLFALFQEANIEQPLKIGTKDGFVGCPSSVTLKFDRHHGYFLCFPFWKKKSKLTTPSTKSQATCPRSSRRLAVALDPGVRTFQTTYDSGGNSVKYGYRCIGRLMCIAKRMDKVQSRLDLLSNQHPDFTKDSVSVTTSMSDVQDEDDDRRVISGSEMFSATSICPSAPLYNLRSERRRLKRQRKQMSAKIDNLKTDIHWKLARELCTSYEHVMIPVFKVSQMVNRFKRKIRCRTVREMLHWSHYAFRQRLHCKGEELQTSIHEVTEEYTTKGCPECGRINHSIGGKEWFNCRNCGYSCDRDRGAGRSIYVKNIETCVGEYDMSSLFVSSVSSSSFASLPLQL